jgi:hypothetical protein
MGALALFTALQAPRGRVPAGPSLETIALGVLGGTLGAAAAILAWAREDRRRAFVARAEAGREAGYRVEPTPEGKVLLRLTSQGEGYRVADFEERVELGLPPAGFVVVSRTEARARLACAPVFKTSSEAGPENARNAAKQAESAREPAPEIPPESDERRPTMTLENKGGTLWDETIAVLTRALEKAETSEERLAFLAEIRAWREGRR